MAAIEVSKALKETLSASQTAKAVNLAQSRVSYDVLYTPVLHGQCAQLVRETIVADRSTAREIALAEIQVIREVLYHPVTWKQAEVFMEVLYDAGTVPTIHAVYSAAFQNVAQAASYLAPSATISTEQFRSFWQQTLAQSDLTSMPVSYSQWATNWQLAVSSLPISTASYETMPTLWSMAAQDAPVTLYPPAQFMASMTSVASICQLTVISLVNAYVPTSGIWNRSYWNLAIQATPDMAIWISDDFIRAQWMKVIQKRDAEYLPHSDDFLGAVSTEVIQHIDAPMPVSYMGIGEYLVQAVQHSDQTAFPISPIRMGAFQELVLQDSPMAEPVGPMDLSAERMLVAQSNPVAMPAGPVLARQIITKAIQGTDYTNPVSYIPLSTTRTLVAQDADYDSTDSYLTKARMGAEQMLVAQGTAYSQPTSTTRLAAILDLKIQAAPADFYPDPDTVYDQSRFSRLISYSFQSVQANPRALPVSFISTPSLRILSLQDAAYDSPEVMASSGSFVYAVAQFIASVATYDAPTPAGSVMQIYQVVETAANLTDYPGKDVPQSYNNVTQVIQSVASVETWTPWEDLHSPVLVNQVVSEVACSSDYDNPYAIHSPVTVNAIAQQVASPSSYPDKDLSQSYAQVYGVGQSLVQRVTYPDKDIPQSMGEVFFLAEQLISKDTKLYGLPTTPRRHRIRVVCNVIYE